MLRRLGLLGFAFALSIAAFGCKADQGERCQVQADCKDGLLCTLPVAGNNLVGGVCLPPGGGDGGTDGGEINDQAAPVDATTD